MAEGRKAVLQVERRTWDTEEYQRRADERREEEERLEKEKEDAAAGKKPMGGAIVRRDPLNKDRSRAGNDLQIDKMVGRTMVVTSNTALAQQGGFYCSVCDCVVKDSISWLDHINGKKHNRALGMNMRAERATLEQVQERLKTHKPSDRKNATVPDSSGLSALDELDAKIQKLKEEEELGKEAKREHKRQKKEEAQASAKEGLADGFEAMMGFGGFGSSKGGNKK